ncbi:MAG TPA: hypothetical protein VID47_05850 [Actinomycetota bacterium]
MSIVAFATSTDHPALHVVSRALLIAGAVAAVAWLLVVLIVRVFRRSDEPEPGPATMDLGPETPALANMLTNNWKPTPEAVPATLLDLAARGFVEFQQVAPGEFQCRIRKQDDPSLATYERRVMTLLRSKESGGVVPTRAMTTGPTDAADRWWKGFRKEVVRDAKDAGLSEDMWNAASRAVVSVAAFVPAILFGIAVPLYGAVYFAVFAVALTGALWGSGRQRSTPAGVEAAARWLGVREYLQQDSVFDTLPPTAVITWERYLGYGAAMGQAAGAARPIAMGAESDRRAWSSVGGEWRQVKVVYPGNVASPGWGRRPSGIVLLSIVAGAASFGLFVLSGGLERLADTGPANQADNLTIGEIAALALGVVVAVAAAIMFLRGAIDLFAKRQVTGEILRARRYGSDDQPQFYLAVDDGSTDRIRAWRVRRELYVRVPEGGWAAATVTRLLRYVRDLQPTPAPPRATSPAGPPPGAAAVPPPGGGTPPAPAPSGGEFTP